MNTPKVKVIFYCWLIYCFLFMNRLHLSPEIPLIMMDLCFSQARFGLIGSSLYIFHMIVQLSAGYLRDLLGARKIIFSGGVVSAVANLVSDHCLNGHGQWCAFRPIIKIIDQHFSCNQRGRVLELVRMSTAVFSVVVFIPVLSISGIRLR